MKKQKIKLNYAEYTKHLRYNFGLTQQALADQLGISFATINRWENNQTEPSWFYWNQLQKLELRIAKAPTRKQKRQNFTAPQESRSTQTNKCTLHPLVLRVLSAGFERGDGNLDGAQMIDGEWWIPKWGCDSINHMLDQLVFELS
jgi:DNA-binding XRE family transcriptional regulator